MFHGNSQVLSALVSYIANVHCWGMQERSEKSVTYGKSFGFNDLQGSSRAESSSPVQYEPGLVCFSSLVIQLRQSLLPVEIDFYFMMPWPVPVTGIIVIGMLEPYQKW